MSLHQILTQDTELQKCSPVLFYIPNKNYWQLPEGVKILGKIVEGRQKKQEDNKMKCSIL